jgi:hypothetical protein
MVSTRTACAAALLLGLAACMPRTPPPAPAPLPPPPPAAPEPDAATRARTAWESSIRMGRQGRWLDAESYLRESVRLQPDSITYHLALANTLIQLSRHSQAADEMWAAIRLEEALPSPNYRVLVVDYDRLIALLDRVQRLDEARTARIRQDEHRRRRDQQ